jgi:hypothetical protein
MRNAAQSRGGALRAQVNGVLQQGNPFPEAFRVVLSESNVRRWPSLSWGSKNECAVAAAIEAGDVKVPKILK